MPEKLHTKNKNMRNSQISLKFFQEAQFLLKLAEICTIQPMDDLEEIQRGFFENFDFSDFMLISHQKIRKFAI